MQTGIRQIGETGVLINSATLGDLLIAALLVVLIIVTLIVNTQNKRD